MSSSRVAASVRQSLKPLRTGLNLLLLVATLAILGAHSAASAATITVPAGGNLQTAINNAQPGDEIVLEAGATFKGPIVLPVKSGSEYITIRSSAISNLPPEGTRVTPAYASAMPKIVSNGSGDPALKTQPGAHHFRFIGIEFKPANSSAVVYDLIRLGSTGTEQNTLSQVPHHLIFDRCYIHGDPASSMKRGIALNSSWTEVINCYISDAKGKGQDTQAIGGWNGPGPFKIINNYLEGAGENLMFGGADPSIPNMVPSDIEIRRNYLYKPLSWRGVWTVKNILELKNAQRVVIDGNVLENNWQDGQEGIAILFTVRNQEGTAPWSIVQDVQFTNNIVRHVASVMSIYGHDDEHQSQRSNTFTIRNNVFEDVDPQAYGGRGLFLLIMDTPNVTVENNTVFHKGNVIMAFGKPSENFVFRNNLSAANEYGIFGDAVGQGNSGINAYFPGGLFQKNLLAGAPASIYPANNFYPATLDSAGFVNRAGGDYRLSASSPYKGAGTNGKDLGCDIDALNAAQSGSQATPPTPTPTPTPLATPLPTPVATPTPTPTPAPTPTPTPQQGTPPPSGSNIFMADDFNDNGRDGAKWSLNVLNDAPTAWDSQVSVVEQNQRLEIVPRSNVSGQHYNGYVAINSYDMTNAMAGVEVLQAASSGADTILAVGLDANNWYRFVVEDGQLYFQDKAGGVKNSANVAYSSTQHRYWRLRHNPTGDQIVFETSADATNWIVQRTINRQINIKTLRVELNAGTFSPVGSPGKAIFDNFMMASNNAAAPPPATGLPAILTSNGAGIVLNAASMRIGPFDVTTPYNWSADKRTRLMIFASGVSSSVNTSHASSYVNLNSQSLPNLADSVTVEARTSDGRVFQLPVEYAGMQGTITGLDQVNVVLVPELQGAGNVQLTLIIGGYRSNTVAISVR